MFHKAEEGGLFIRYSTNHALHIHLNLRSDVQTAQAGTAARWIYENIQKCIYIYIYVYIYLLIIYLFKDDSVQCQRSEIIIEDLLANHTLLILWYSMQIEAFGCESAAWPIDVVHVESKYINTYFRSVSYNMYNILYQYDIILYIYILATWKDAFLSFSIHLQIGLSFYLLFHPCIRPSIHLLSGGCLPVPVAGFFVYTHNQCMYGHVCA